jgi:chloramphenicol-sensitive protein RarD
MADTHSAAGPRRLTSAQRGVLYAVIAHLFWGVMALYFSFITHISAVEIAVHRGLWSLPVATMIVWWLGQWNDVRQAILSLRKLGILALTSSIIVFNWSFYVWAIAHGRALEASLGYFINPLLNVVAGYLFLGERFGGQQLAAIGLAVVGVGVQTMAAGSFPWLGLMLGASFCVYGLLRKMVPVGPTQGFFIEVLLMSVPLFLAEIWLFRMGAAKFGGAAFDTLMLAGCGLLTTGALVFFAASLKLIRYSTAGMLQYISPSLVFLTAVFVLGESMNLVKLASFALIWLALGIYTWGMLQDEQRRAVAGASAA